MLCCLLCIVQICWCYSNVIDNFDTKGFDRTFLNSWRVTCLKKTTQAPKLNLNPFRDQLFCVHIQHILFNFVWFFCMHKLNRSSTFIVCMKGFQKVSELILLKIFLYSFFYISHFVHNEDKYINVKKKYKCCVSWCDKSVKKYAPLLREF